MATFKASIKTKKEDGTYAVYIRVTQNRKISYLNTGMVIFETKVKEGEIIDQMVLAQCGVKIKGYLDKLNTQDTQDWTVQEVVEFITCGNEKIPFIPFCVEFINNLRNKGKDRTADGYQDALSSFRKFFGENIAFQDLNSKGINKWIESLMHTARAKQKYPVNIKTMFLAGDLEYNDYDNNRIRIANRPFHKVIIPQSDETQKKAVEAKILRQMFSATPDTQLSKFSLDVAKMIFYLVAINSVDLYYMEKSELKDGKLCYNRHKTESTRSDKAYIEVKIRPEIMELIDKYKDTTDSKYLFKFKSMYCNEKEFNRGINDGMKRLCDIAGIESMTTYTLRHTWATVAKRLCKASDELIGFSLNHGSAHKTSRIYIKLDYTPIDELNDQVLDKLFNPDKEVSQKKKKSKKVA